MSENIRAWALSKPAAEEDATRFREMQAVMTREDVQENIKSFVAESLEAIYQWQENTLDQSGQLKSAEASRAINLIVGRISHPKNKYNYQIYQEEQTKISLALALVLIWKALQDSQAFGLEAFDDEAQCVREEKLIKHLSEMMREYNRDLNTDLDLDPRALDAPACPGGIFNSLSLVLTGGLHPLPEIPFIFVDKNTIKLKASALLGPLFNLNDYTDEEKADLMCNFLEDCTYLLPPTVIARLQEKILASLKEEFEEFVEAKFIHLRDIENGAAEALKSLTPASAKKIASDLFALQEASKMSGVEAAAAVQTAEEEPPRKRHRPGRRG